MEQKEQTSSLYKNSLRIDGFSISSSLDGEQSPRRWDELESDKFIHIGISSNLSFDASKLTARYRMLDDGDQDDPGAERPMPDAKPISASNFVLSEDHYVFQSGNTYLVRIADNFDDPKALCSTKIHMVP